MATTFIGAWRSGNDGHQLWQGADWTHFQAKWSEFSNEGYRLTDITTYIDGGQRLWAGVFRAGTDGHYLWANADWASFQAKFNELSNEGLRLVDVKAYVDGGTPRFAGVWRAGTDAHYLWCAQWDSFQAKWSELSAQGLRLVAVDTFVENGHRMWIGAFRAGTDGHYFWAGDDWTAFQARWQQLAAQGLRLVDVETYVDGGQRKFVGVWRAGTDGYTLWWGSDLENFLGQWNHVSTNGQRLVSLAAIDAPCQGDCCNHVVSRDKNNQPAPYVYYVTGDPGGPYRWPVDDNQYARLSALTFQGQPFTLPFKDTAVVHWGTWLYSAPPGNWHHAIDYLRESDWKTFEAVAAAPGKVVFSGWDNWSGNTIIVSHDAGGVTDAFRTIYMHLRNGVAHDIDKSWNQSVPPLSGAGLTNYKAYLNATGATQNAATRHPDANYWGTDAQKIDASIVGKTVKTGDHLAWAGCTGPGGCGSMDSLINHPNTHLHVFFAHRDPSDNNWYFIDPYGVYSYPSAGYPSGVTAQATGPCVRYSVSWKGGKPQYP